MEEQENKRNYPWEKRNPESHKGSYGHLFVMGGSPGFTGAVCLAAQAALRSGVGLVTVGIPESLNDILEVKLTEPMSLPLPETGEKTFSLRAAELALDFIRERSDAAVIGPGISLHPETINCLTSLIPQIPVPMVIDADALKIISTRMEIMKKLKAPVILTPHPGEMGYLVGKSAAEVQKDRLNLARRLAEEYQVVVVLKGHRTVVTDGHNATINLTGNAGMATAGAGDVLSGIAGSFLAQGMQTLEAASWAVYFHGLAGDLAVSAKGEISLIASDLIEYLPLAFQMFKRKGAPS